MRTALSLLLLAAAAAADTRLERAVTWDTSRPGGASERSVRRETVLLGDGRLRVDDRVSRESWIVRADHKTLVRIDHALETWSETTFEEAARERAAVAADLRAALARVAGSEDETRLRRFLEAFAPEPRELEVRAAGAGGTIAGRETKAWSLAAGGDVVMEAKSAEGLAGLDRLVRCLSESGLMERGQAGKLAGAKGLPLAGSWTLVFPDALVRETFETLKVEEVEAPKDAYDAPAGYKKVPAPSLTRRGMAAEAPPGGHAGDAEGEDAEEEAVGEEAGRDD